LESLYIRLQPPIDMGYTQIDQVGQILREIQGPFRVVAVLPRGHLVPGLTERPKERLVVCYWSIRSSQQKLGLCILLPILGFDHLIGIKVLWSSVWYMTTSILGIPSAVLARGRSLRIPSLEHLARSQGESLHDAWPQFLKQIF
jgi:hypothetical protein